MLDWRRASVNIGALRICPQPVLPHAHSLNEFLGRCC
jgi:hypothetical protein